MRDLEHLEEYQPYYNNFSNDKSRFDFAFGTNLPNLDPSIAYFEVNEINIQTINVSEKETKKIKTVRPLEIGKCGTNTLLFSDAK